MKWRRRRRRRQQQQQQQQQQRQRWIRKEENANFKLPFVLCCYCCRYSPFLFLMMKRMTAANVCVCVYACEYMASRTYMHVERREEREEE